MGIYRRLTTADGAESVILTTSDTYMTTQVDSYELEDLEITPQTGAQSFKSDKYGYNKVFVRGIKGENIEVDPGKDEQSFEGVYRRVVVHGDENLSPENIKQGATIFGVTGAAANTDDGTAVSDDIADGKIAYVQDRQVVGSATTVEEGSINGIYQDIVEDKDEGTMTVTVGNGLDHSLMLRPNAGITASMPYDEIIEAGSITADKIVVGNSIMGVAGMRVDTTDGTITPADVAQGKVGYAQDERIVGIVPVIDGAYVSGEYTSFTDEPENKQVYVEVRNNTGDTRFIKATGGLQAAIPYHEITNTIGLTPDKLLEGNVIAGVEGSAKINGDIEYNYTTLDASIRTSTLQKFVSGTKYYKDFTATLENGNITFTFNDKSTSELILDAIVGNSTILAWAIGYEPILNRRYIYVALNNNTITIVETSILSGTILSTEIIDIYNDEAVFDGKVRTIAITPSMYSLDFVYEYDYGTDTEGEVRRNYVSYHDAGYRTMLLSSSTYKLDEGSTKDKSSVMDCVFFNERACIDNKQMLIIHKGDFVGRISTGSIVMPDEAASNSLYLLGINSINTKIVASVYGDARGAWVYDVQVTDDEQVLVTNPTLISGTATLQSLNVSAYYNFGGDMLFFTQTGMAILFDSIHLKVSRSASIAVTNPVLNTEDTDYTYYIQNGMRTYVYYLTLVGTQVISGLILNGEHYLYIDDLELTTANKILIGGQAVTNSGITIGTMPNNGRLSYGISESVQTIPAGYTSGGTIAAFVLTDTDDYRTCLALSRNILGTA